MSTIRHCMLSNARIFDRVEDAAQTIAIHQRKTKMIRSQTLYHIDIDDDGVIVVNLFDMHGSLVGCIV